MSSVQPLPAKYGCIRPTLAPRSIDDQRAVAERFAGRDGLRGPHRYAEAAWAPLATGALALEGALAAIDCELEEAFERHSHALVLGRVSAITLGTGAALLYGDGRYGTFAGLVP